MIKKNRIPQVIKAVEAANEKALTAACLLVHGEAVLRSAVDTGNLKNSIAYEVRSDEGRVGTNVEYAPYVEMGTSKMSAQPFLRPALDGNKAKIQKLMGEIYGSAAKGAAK